MEKSLYLVASQLKNSRIHHLLGHPLTILQRGDVKDLTGLVPAAQPGVGLDHHAVTGKLAEIGQAGHGSGGAEVEVVGRVPVLHRVEQDDAIGKQGCLPRDQHLSGVDALVGKVEGGAPRNCIRKGCT